MGAWDTIALSVHGRKGTVSYLLTMMTYHAPIIAFLFGAIAGHLFWPQNSYPEDVILEKVIEVTIDEKGNVKSTRSWYVENR